MHIAFNIHCCLVLASVFTRFDAMHECITRYLKLYFIPMSCINSRNLLIVNASTMLRNN